MARPGPPPTPTRLRVLRGNPGKRPLPEGEPVPAPGKPNCPAWLSKDAKVIWRRITRELEALGLLAKCDQDSIACLCQAIAEVKIATEILDQEGRTYRNDETGVRHKHPAVELQRDAMGRVKAFLGEFGLSPSSRTRVKAPPKGEGDDPFESYLSGKESG